MTAYSFDRKDLEAALKQAADLGSRVRLLVDQRMTMTGKTADQLRIIRRLAVPGVRVQVHKTSGRSLAEHYGAVGRSFKIDYMGQLHAKYLRVDREVLVGSANWTTASRGNLEAVVKLTLNDDGMERFRTFFDQWWVESTIFTEAGAEMAEDAARLELERRSSTGATSSTSRSTR